MGYFAVPAPKTPYPAFDIGKVRLPADMVKKQAMLCPPGTSCACHVGTLVHAHNEWLHHEVGVVEVDKVDLCWKKARELGFDIGFPKGFTGNGGDSKKIA